MCNYFSYYERFKDQYKTLRYLKVHVRSNILKGGWLFCKQHNPGDQNKPTERGRRVSIALRAVFGGEGPSFHSKPRNASTRSLRTVLEEVDTLCCARELCLFWIFPLVYQSLRQCLISIWPLNCGLVRLGAPVHSCLCLLCIAVLDAVFQFSTPLGSACYEAA